MRSEGPHYELRDARAVRRTVSKLSGTSTTLAAKHSLLASIHQTPRLAGDRLPESSRLGCDKSAQAGPQGLNGLAMDLGYASLRQLHLRRDVDKRNVLKVVHGQNQLFT